MKNAIITGGTGMIGHALIEYLLKQDVKVTVLARSSSGRLSSIPNDERVTIVNCDLSELNEVELSEDHFDVFFHLGWAGTFGDARNDMFLQNNNIRYTLDAVGLAHRLGCTTFVGAGSQAEFGRVDGEKLSPSTRVNPENGYGMAKLCAGQMSRVLANHYGIKHIWFRILSVFGPFDGENTMIMSSIIKMISGETPEYTPAEQVWDYLYSEDAAKALYLGAERGKDGSIYCLGSGFARPLREYVEMIRDYICRDMELEFGTKPYADKQVMYLCADITNLKNDTGFIPENTFQEGVSKTVEWYRRIADEKNQCTNTLL